MLQWMWWPDRREADTVCTSHVLKERLCMECGMFGCV
jgi:hypothetical protein